MESGDPSPILEVLTRHGVAFVVIGGHAVNYDGFVRATEDTDLPVQQLFDSAEQSGAYRYVSLAWLRRLKRASGRPKDQLDLANLPESDGGGDQE